MNIPQRIRFLQKANSHLSTAHVLSASLPHSFETVAQVTNTLTTIRDLEVALAALKSVAEAAVVFKPEG